MDWTTRRSRFNPQQRQEIFSLTSVSRTALGPTQPPVQLVPGVLSPGLKCGRCVTLTTHRHLMPKSRMSRSYTSSPPFASIGVLQDCFILSLAHFSRTISNTFNPDNMNRVDDLCLSQSWKPLVHSPKGCRKPPPQKE
jgi:hypothetical protein